MDITAISALHTRTEDILARKDTLTAEAMSAVSDALKSIRTCTIDISESPAYAMVLTYDGNFIENTIYGVRVTSRKNPVIEIALSTDENGLPDWKNKDYVLSQYDNYTTINYFSVLESITNTLKGNPKLLKS